jgi:hypothetical protein
VTDRVILQPKRPGETKSYAFDFISQLAAGETLSTQVVTATVWSGTDASPSSLISGAATSSGSIVSQLITAGVAGVTYYLLCTVTTSTGQTLQLAAFLVVLPTPVL